MFLFAAVHAVEHLSQDILCTEAAAAWKRLETQCRQNACTTWTTTRIENLSHKKSKTNTYRHVLNTLNDMFALETCVPEGTHTGSNFVVRNKNYAFETGRTMKEDAWHRSYWGNDDNRIIQNTLDTDIAVLKSPWSIYTAIPMYEIVRDPDFL
jgi:hypothetical protein